MNRWRRGLMGAAVGALCCTASWQSAADVLPPPPDCSADSSGQPCTVEFFRSPSVQGTCFLGEDEAAYCRVDTTCYPAVPAQGSGDNVGVPCPAAASDDDEDEGEGCAVRAWRAPPALVALLPLAALALATVRRRRR
jgi:MYXO-CTERM domain-containing protein